MTKRELRRELRSEQKALSEEYVKSASQRMEEAFLDSPLYQNARSIFLYLNTKQEPSTRRILKEALKAGKTVAVPKCLENGEMAAVRYKEEDPLITTSMGIEEPLRAEDTLLKEGIDLIIVPCLSANQKGERLGHGGGYYDRFLHHFRGNTVCFCFEKMVCSKLETEVHDEPVGYLCTEAGIRKCEK